MSAASDTRLLLPPVTVTTGVMHAGPRCVLWAALSPNGQTRLRNRSRRPGPPRSFYHRPGLLPPRSDRRLVTLGGPPCRDLDAPADPVQQQVRPRQGVVHPEPAAHDFGDPGQRPALILIPVLRGRPGVQQRRQLPQLGRAQPALRAARAPVIGCCYTMGCGDRRPACCTPSAGRARMAGSPAVSGT